MVQGLKKEYEKINPDELKKRKKSANTWFLSNIQKAKGKVTPQDLFKGRKETRKPLLGQMLFFEYDAKHKDTLPYWDMFPLSIIIDIKEDSFLSLNLHYLPFDLREVLINRLLSTINDDRLDHRSKAKINYNIVKAASRYEIAKPCIKRHLYSQIRSKIVRIKALDWREAIYLDVDRFVGASRRKVWSDSRKSAGKYKK